MDRELLRKITIVVCLFTVGLCFGALFKAEIVKSQCKYKCNMYICEKYDSNICPIDKRLDTGFMNNYNNISIEVDYG